MPVNILSAFVGDILISSFTPGPGNTRSSNRRYSYFNVGFYGSEDAENIYCTL